METLLQSVLSERASAVELPPAAWDDNARRVRRDTRRRTGLALASLVLVATTGVLGFRFVHEPGRGEPVPVQPLGTVEPAPR